MGMYTELIFGASLKQTTPHEVINSLHELIGEAFPYQDKGVDPKAPNGGRSALAGSSYYFGVSRSFCNIWRDKISDDWRISSRANIKNYEGEIETFLEWIKPYIQSGSGSREMYAIVTYEEASEPTIYYLNEKEED